MDMNDFNLEDKNRISPGFTTPENYFDAFPEKLMQQLPSPQPKVIPLWERGKKWAYAAVAVLVLSVSIPVVDYYKADARPQNASEIENYLSYQSTITDDDLIELMGNEALEPLPAANDPESSAMEEILTNNSHLEDYIIN